MPETTTCASIAGVTKTFTTRDAMDSALIPGRRREPRLRRSHLVGPDDDLLTLLPLEGHHPVRDLEAVLVHLVVAEDGAHLELEQLLAHTVRVERARPLDGLGVDEAAGVPRRRVIRRLVAELLLVRLEELGVVRIGQDGRSEERRVGKECRSRWSPYH